MKNLQFGQKRSVYNTADKEDVVAEEISATKKNPS
jgi:hypothetical protein